MLEKTTIDTLRPAILGTWGQIAGDAYEVCEGDNELAMELVLDANRMMFSGYDAEDKLVGDLSMALGFGVVRKQLSDAIQLL